MLMITNLKNPRALTSRLRPTKNGVKMRMTCRLGLGPTKRSHAFIWSRAIYLLCGLIHTLPSGAWVLNNPYPPAEKEQKIYYTSFSEQPKTLDPAKSYTSSESPFTGQIYEPVLQYDYLARPYRLVPLLAAEMPSVTYYDANNNIVPANFSGNIIRSVYHIRIQPHIYYQPHLAFASDENGPILYPHTPSPLNLQTLSTPPAPQTRELIADDYVYEIKRLANPAINSPVLGLLREHIIGFREFASLLPKTSTKKPWVDLRRYPLTGVKTLSRYEFEISIYGQYTPFIFWLAMPFFAPIPWEADRFYAQPGLHEKNIGFDWDPVGTGAFMLTENNPNNRMELTRNPHYRTESLTGKEKLPFIDKAIFTLEKESIPRWNKFLQGYYDLSGVTTDSLDEAIMVSSSGLLTLAPKMQKKGIRFYQTNEAALFYLGFNMRDSVVGGKSARARYLRQAISIIMDYDEYINLFLNGRGTAAQGPIPTELFGYRSGKAGTNPYVYRWKNGTRQRRSIDEAITLLRKAGYPNGRDPTTHQPLILHYDVPMSGSPDEKAQLDWMHRQFQKVGIALDVRTTQYNPFQQKLRQGNVQLFFIGWIADYPDPENFLFLLYGPNGKVLHGGENASNYNNPRYDALFEAMKNKPDNPERQRLIDQMVDIVRYDAPWVWGIHSKTFVLSQQWLTPPIINLFAHNTLKYLDVNVADRNIKRAKWNQAILWPIGLFVMIIALLLLPFFNAYRKQQRAGARKVALS